MDPSPWRPNSEPGARATAVRGATRPPHGDAASGRICTNPKTASDPGGTTILCDDKDDDGQEDARENLATVGTGDLDADSVPDAVESTLCGRALVRDTINGNSPTTGSCPTLTNYVPPAGVPNPWSL